MSTCIINPVRSKGEPELPETGILAVNPADGSGFANFAKLHRLERHHFFHAQLYSNSTFFLAGPAMGAPMAAFCLEKLIALGARRIIVYGWCGSLHPSLKAGDLFMPTGGVSEEGTSSHYPSQNTCIDTSLRLQIATALTVEGSAPKQGYIWTTDAVYRETVEKIERYSSEGILAVDMEFTALCAVAAFRQVHLAAIMLVSDELFHRVWTPRFGHKQFRVHSRHTLGKLCTMICAREML